jgi:hypothetical protein
MEIYPHEQRHRTLHEEFKRRIETQTVLSRAEMAAMLFWALLASGQIAMRRSTTGSPRPKSAPIKPLTSRHDRIAS